MFQEGRSGVGQPVTPTKGEKAEAAYAAKLAEYLKTNGPSPLARIGSVVRAAEDH